MSVRIAVIGAGIMGADHARIVSEDLPGATLQVVCDAAPERARTVAESCGAADAATDPLATIGRNDVDAVLIASPDDTHAPLTLAAIAAGKPLLCEKPLSQQSAECLGVIDAEVKRGRRFVQVGFMRRFDPSYRDMKAALDDGSLGRAIMMHNVHRNVEVPPSFTPQMAITNSAPHEFDIARFVLGADTRAISVFQPAGGDTSKGVGPVFMVLETAGGQLVNIEINNNAAYGYDVRGELVGATGTISLNASAPTRRNGALMEFARYAPDWRARFAEAYRLQDKAFVGFVRTGTFPPSAADAWDGYCATRVAEAGVEALARGQRVAVTMAEMPPLYRR
jgi:myo-inositol 2-dehydrogenase/D-chiro-inositol 1-dehydrogenase